METTKVIPANPGFLTGAVIKYRTDSDTSTAQPITTGNQPSIFAGPFHGLFQMLLGSSFIKKFYHSSRREPAHYFQLEWTHVRCYAVKISTRSPRGFGTKILGRSTSSGSREPTSSANIRCCFFNSTITSGDGGADFSAICGDGSRMEKFTAKMKTQTAASPAQALGCGQKKVES